MAKKVQYVSSYGSWVSGNVRAEIARARVSQTVVAEWLGLSQSAVSSKMRDLTAWSFDEVDMLAHHLGVPLGRLIAPPTGLEPVTLCLEDDSGCDADMVDSVCVPVGA